MRALITGGAGFIGSHLSEALLAAGHDVLVIDNLSTGSIGNVAHLKGRSGFEYHIDSITNEPLLAELVDRADVVFHFAAAVGVKLIVEQPVHTIETNVHGTEVVLKHANKKKKLVVIASTSEVYGKSEDVPFREDADLVMLTLWMFGTELERVWGTRYFLKYYFATGIGAGVLTVLIALLPFGFAQEIYWTATIGASGAIFGLLLAYGLYYPDRPIYLYFVFPIPARYFVLIIGAISLFAGGGIAHATHLGGVVIGYAMLKSTRIHPLSELKYRYLKWKINRVRRKFDVYSGGRADDWDHRVH